MALNYEKAAFYLLLYHIYMHDIISCSENKSGDLICPFSCNLLQKFGSQIFNFFFLLRSVDQKFRKLSMHVNVFKVYCFKQNHYYIHIYRYLGY